MAKAINLEDFVDKKVHCVFTSPATSITYDEIGWLKKGCVPSIFGIKDYKENLDKGYHFIFKDKKVIIEWLKPKHIKKIEVAE